MTPFKNKFDRNAYMRKYYASNPEQREKHRLACKAYHEKVKKALEGLENAKNTI